MNVMTPVEFDALSRRDPEVFIERVFAELNPSTTFAYNFHIGVIAAKLEAVRRGKIKRLIINVPPRSLKSIAASVAFPAWVLGHDPTKQIICVSYGQELADSLARDCRQVMQQPWYQRMFPGTALSPTRTAVHAFETTAGGGRIATSVGGVLTGMGADIIVIDDPIKPDEALSDVERVRANHWFRHTLVTRLNDKSAGAIVVVMQRLHEDDFVGHILELDDWEVVSFPAIALEDEVHVVETAFGAYTHVRREGEALHPEREPLEVLEALRRSLGADHFSAQYLQSPTPPGGGKIKVAWFKRYDTAPDRFDRIIQSWDTASKVKELSDYSVCTTWGVKGKEFYLLHVWRKRVEYPELKAAVKAQAALYPNCTVLIEDKGSGTALIQELRRENVTVTRYEPKGDKIFRMEGQTALIENGMVWLPREAHWLDDFLHELIMFPKGKFDDQVDSMSQALDHARNHSSADAWIEWARKQALKAYGITSEPHLRVRHASGNMTLYTITGRRPPLEPGGYFLLTEEEWKCLRGKIGWSCENEGEEPPE
ncbi:MAG TPA: phage terminase large subunit [Caulobacteraceae bacterium]|nr:phage terminase large subunit [Caulobacteraceae bacterium]